MGHRTCHHSYVNFKFLNLKTFLQYLIYELRYRSLNLDKCVEQELLFYSLREIIKLNLNVFLLNFPYYLSCI